MKPILLVVALSAAAQAAVVDWPALRRRADESPTPAATASGEFRGPRRSISGQFRDGLEPGDGFDAASETYRIGDEWGKKPVTADALGREDAVFQRAAKAAAAYGGATGFYLGRFEGRHVFATNYHVSERSCRGSARLPLLGKSYPCDVLLGSWPEVDLALFTARVPASDDALLAGLANNFAWDAAIRPGQELLTVGFGTAGNGRRQPMSNKDADCKVFSAENEFRLMADPDEINPGSYEAWSFANGCDVSHGDSGSAFVDRRTGALLGLVWTGGIPKSAETGRSATLARWMSERSPEIWTQLTFSVPAAKIRERLREHVRGLPAGGETRRVLEAVLESR